MPGDVDPDGLQGFSHYEEEIFAYHLSQLLGYKRVLPVKVVYVSSPYLNETRGTMHSL